MPRFSLKLPGQIGAARERQARAHLEHGGLLFVDANYHCRLGEIDLIMRDGTTLVFVEVRYRASDRFGTPAETVTRAKQRRLQAAAGHYLQAHPSNAPCRFDVVAIGGEHRIEWIRDAFRLE